ncbi:insulinase family protein [Siminovitchia acidinfaciens]|uniref:Insulinase family protein n=1 Tax=Siminovitchia acidinfaciens TaxID=2321395 RepID=A0A429Y2W4_9BACI|nr:pitrilysin family protein [Siminovitchia acidinfaciens]RST75538.1 insulinase family protein [Siminovitchia acidinfaciens]
MSLLREETVKKQGYNLHLIQTGKFKTNTFIWKMKAPLDEKTVTYRALLPHVLQSSTKKHSSTAQLRSYLDNLYGASLHVDLGKKGDYHIITLTIEVANEAFLKDSTPLLQKAVQLLKEILLEPNANNGAFDSETVEKEKRTLKQRIKSVYDDKMRYATYRVTEEMCKEEPYSLYVHGQLDQVDDITETSLYKYYEQALNEDELDLYIVGDIDKGEVEQYCDELQFADREPKRTAEPAVKENIEVKEIIERQDLKQGKLNIGYRTNILYGEKDYFPLQLVNGIFGGFPHSKLFINVREKENLAYYAASRIESHKGLLMVMSGIDDQNYVKAVNIIKEQMELMKNGDFTDEEIKQTKAVIQNQFLETIDTARGLIEVLYHNVVAHTSINLDEWQDHIANTTKEDIVNAARKIEMDTIYFLTGMKEGDNR